MATSRQKETRSQDFKLLLFRPGFEPGTSRLRAPVDTYEPSWSAALIASNLNYCNDLLHDATNQERKMLQGIQSCLARVVRRSPSFI